MSNKGGATTHLQGSLQNIKVHPGSSDPPSDWKTWEEYLKLKPGEFTPDQIVPEITRNRVKAVARIKEAAAAEVGEADKVDDAIANKDDSKPATSKPK